MKFFSLYPQKLLQLAYAFAHLLQRAVLKQKRYILYLRTVNIQNEMDTGEAVNKARNSLKIISLLLKVTFWWYTLEKISQYPAVSVTL